MSKQRHWSGRCTALFLTISMLFSSVVAAEEPAKGPPARHEVNVCYNYWFGTVLRNQSPGPDVEVAELFRAYLGRPVRLNRVIWSELFRVAGAAGAYPQAPEPELMERGHCDIYAANITVTPERQKLVRFVSLFPTRMMVMVPRQQRARYKQVEDLGGQRTVVTAHTTYEEWLHQINATELKARPIRITDTENQDTVELLLAGKADFVLLDTYQALHVVRTLHPEVSIAFPVGPTDEIAWAFRRHDTELAAAFQKFLDSQRDNPQSPMNRIFIKYYGMTLNTLFQM